MWASWGGWILIMKKADMERYNREVRAMPALPDNWHERKAEQQQIYQKWIDAGLGGDDKADNYGYYQDRLVKVDYAS